MVKVAGESGPGAGVLRISSTYAIMDQLNGSLVPAERLFILDSTEELRRRSNKYWGGEATTIKILHEGGCEAALQIMRVFKNDEIVLRAAAGLMLTMAEVTVLVVQHLLVLGARDTLEAVQTLHGGDKFLEEDCHRLIDLLQTQAGKQASSDAQMLKQTARFCSRCKPLSATQIGNENNPVRTGPQGTRTAPVGTIGSPEGLRNVPGKFPADDDSGEHTAAECIDWERKQIERIVRHMVKYPKTVEVIEPCVDAFTVLGSKFNAEAIAQSRCIPTLLTAMKAYASDHGIAWKGCVAITTLAVEDSLCFLLGISGAVPLLMELWNIWDVEDMRQLILWALGNLCRLEDNQVLCKSSKLGALIGHVIKADGDVGGLSYCVPLQLQRAYKLKRIGTPEDIQDDGPNSPRSQNNLAIDSGVPLVAMNGRVDDLWNKGEKGLLED